MTHLSTIFKSVGISLAIGIVLACVMFSVAHLHTFDASSPDTYNRYAKQAGCTDQTLVQDEEGEYMTPVCTQPREVARAQALAVAERQQGFFEFGGTQFILITCSIGGLIGGFLAARDNHKHQKAVTMST